MLEVSMCWGRINPFCGITVSEVLEENNCWSALISGQVCKITLEKGDPLVIKILSVLITFKMIWTLFKFILNIPTNLFWVCLTCWTYEMNI